MRGLYTSAVYLQQDDCVVLPIHFTVVDSGMFIVYISGICPKHVLNQSKTHRFIVRLPFWALATAVAASEAIYYAHCLLLPSRGFWVIKAVEIRARICMIAFQNVFHASLA